MATKRSISFQESKESLIGAIGERAKELGVSWSAAAVRLIEAGLCRQQEHDETILGALSRIENRLALFQTGHIPETEESATDMAALAEVKRALFS